ncbi:ABC transporter substrate-binding protein [Cupriavidus necator]|uniref:ABC transporter substrate-binding protein n=1 Tax=Cupriavidus necator TaxID=106590 RepID=UPI0022AACD4D|nr:ABC transporter substrate-binding protein [Cupriavidus necator]MDX6008671.1 ABC transporter substrate-binding protein [Cupriavidus necator]
MPIISVHGTATYETVKAMGEAADNIIHPEFIVSEDPLPGQKEFVETFRKEYGKLPKHFSAVGWDAVMALAAGLKAAGADAPGDKLCSALRRPYQGVTSGYDFAAPDMGGRCRWRGGTSPPSPSSSAAAPAWCAPSRRRRCSST